MGTPKSFKGFIAKCTVISMLALSIGTGSAWADDTESQVAVTANAESTSTTETEQETTTLVSGDLFYFVKTIYERIQLAFASNDMKEAILLAQFAQERLIESAILLEEGQADETAVTTTTDEKPAEAQPALQHNIVALAAALDKVNNPQAKRSLLKNITKSFDHLEKKLTKFSTKNERDTGTEIETEIATGTESSTAKAMPTTSTTSKTTTTTTTEDDSQEKFAKLVDKKKEKHASEKQRNKKVKPRKISK